VAHPDFDRFNASGDDERLLEAAVVLLRNFGPRVFDDFSEGFPKVEGPPGLRALVAPDGVTVRVLGGAEDDRDVVRAVMHDVADRYVRPEVAGMIASGKSPEEIQVAACRTLLRVQGQYRVELLGEPRSAPGRHP
jgi:hypothetical protein